MTAFNPVLRRELLERWRGSRAFLVITLYVAVLAGMVQLLWWVGNSVLDDQFRFGGIPETIAGPVLGRFLFENLAAFVLLLVLFITPGYAAAQISGERERRTLALLQITKVGPLRIAAGKLGAATAWSLLLVVAAVPFAATAFLLGGVSVADLLRVTAFVVVTAISVAGLGLGISAITRRTTTSVIATYGAVLVLTIGSAFGGVVENVVRDIRFTGGEAVSMYGNPFYGLADASRAAESRFAFSGLGSVLTVFAEALPQENRGGGLVEGGFPGGFDGPVPAFDGPAPPEFLAEREAVLRDRAIEIGQQPGGFDQDRQPVWLKVLALQVALGFAGFVVAAQRVRPERPPFLGRRRRRRRVTAEGARIEPLAPAAGEEPAADRHEEDEP